MKSRRCEMCGSKVKLHTSSEGTSFYVRDLSPVERAALAWWRGHRPVGWSLSMHLKCPLVNVLGGRDDRLAKAVLKLLPKARRKA